jgi:eukaryotic-like serine/threonine-protein kinase
MSAHGPRRMDPRARTRIGRPDLDEPLLPPGMPSEPIGDDPTRPDAGAGAHDAPDEGFRLGAALGQSDGEVYETRHPRLPGRFAIKLLKGGAGASPEAIESFRTDLERIATLRHPNIVEVLEVGAMSDGTPVMIMERLDGQTLAERMGRRKTMPLPEVLPIIRGIATGLEAAHRLGVVHREIRPDNVFLADVAGYDQGFVKLLDFGVAHLSWQGSLTRFNETHLSAEWARYLAPEQAEGRLDDVDGRTDQFALAAVAYRLASGQDPFPGGELVSVLERVKTARPLPLAGIIACDPRVDDVLGRALARVQSQRFESVLAFVKALEEVAGASVAAPAAAVARRPTPVRNARTVSEPTLPSQPVVAEVGHQDVTRKSSNRLVEATARRDSSPRRDSVSRMFFEEGEHKEQGNWAASDLAEPDVDPEAMFDSFDKLPRRRMRFLPVLVLAGAAAVGAAIWFGWRPSFGPTGEGAKVIPAQPERPATESATEKPATEKPAETTAAASATPAPAAPNDDPSVANPIRPVATPPEAPEEPAAAAPAAAVPPAAPPAVAASPSERPAPAPPAATVTAPATGTSAPAAAAPVPSVPAAAAPAPTAAAPVPPVQIFPTEAAARNAVPGGTGEEVAPSRARPRPTEAARPAPPKSSDPLRGYVWSPREQRLVPADSVGR